jgi:PhnB protein
MRINPYVDFNGQCEAAFKFYAQCLGGQVTALLRYAGSPLSEQVPASWQDKVMHATLTIDDQVIQGADVAADRYERPQGFSLTLQMRDTREAERVFNALAHSGSVVIPLAKTFWAARFGVLVDQFGIRWLINCDGSAQKSERAR